MAALQRGSDCKEDSHRVNATDNLLFGGMRQCEDGATDNLPSVGMHQGQGTIMVQFWSRPVAPACVVLALFRPAETTAWFGPAHRSTLSIVPINTI